MPSVKCDSNCNNSSNFEKKAMEEVVVFGVINYFIRYR